MITDLKPTPAAVRLCVEQYGSLAHLADAIGVAPAKLWAWMDGTERVPLESYLAMLDVLFDKALKRSNHE